MLGLRVAFLCCLALVVFSGCDEHSGRSRTETSVNVQSFLMDAAAFDLEAVIAKLKEGKLADAQELEKFINTADGVNNVDIDKDGQIDELTVKEEKNAEGKTAMAVVAHPKKGEESVIAEIGFEKNTTTNEVEVSGAYPSYVRGYNDHYYHHTLTGSTLGDMMFYSWLFSPRPVYMPTYRYGMYYSSPRSVMSRQQLRSTRTTYRKTTKMAPIKKQARPSSYKPRTKVAQKSASTFKKSTASNSKLSSRKGSSSSFTKRSGTKSKASGWGSSSKSRSSSKSSWGSSSRSRSSFGSSSRRRSSAQYKCDIQYLNDQELVSYAAQLHSMPLATWRYTDQTDDHTNLGIITEDVGKSVATSSDLDAVDLYGYTSLAVAAIQVQQQELDALRHEVQVMRSYVLTECR